MFSFGPTIKLESLATGKGDEEEAEPPSLGHTPFLNCHALLGTSLFHSLAYQDGGVGMENRRAMLSRLGGGGFAAAGGELGGEQDSCEPGGVSRLAETLSERLQADYLQYCLAKESARLFYTRLAAQLQPPPQTLATRCALKNLEMRFSSIGG